MITKISIFLNFSKGLKYRKNLKGTDNSTVIYSNQNSAYILVQMIKECRGCVLFLERKFKDNLQRPLVLSLDVSEAL